MWQAERLGRRDPPVADVAGRGARIALIPTVDVAGKQPGRLTPTAEAARPSSRSRDPDRCLGHAAAFSACISGPRGPLSRNVT